MIFFLVKDILFIFTKNANKKKKWKEKLIITDDIQWKKSHETNEMIEGNRNATELKSSVLVTAQHDALLLSSTQYSIES